MERIVHVLLRLGIGISMFGHGVVRLPKLETFSGWMVRSFEKSFLPEFLVTYFSYVLPVAEFFVGLLLLSGLFTRAALISGAVIVLMLLFGSSMIENWEALPSQLIHLAFFAVLIQYFKANTFALDNLISKNKRYEQ